MNIICIVLCALLLPSYVIASLPVIDIGTIANLIKTYEQLQQQYTLLKTTYKNAQEQLKQAQEMVNAFKGHYGYGELLNRASDLLEREWSPETWKDALNSIAGGNLKRYQQLIKQYLKDNNILSKNDYKKGASKENTTLYRHQVATNQAVTVNSSHTYDTIKTLLKNIHHISEQIESAKNEKAAIDLGSRIQVETTYTLAQILKQISLLTQQVARNSADNISSETQSAQFNRLPDE